MSDNNTTRRRFLQVASGSAAVALAGCLGGSDDGDDSMGDGDGGSDSGDDTMDDGSDGMDDTMDDGPEPTDPSEAPRASIDRFSDEAGTLMVRTEENGLPGPDEPVDFDQGPFITKGLGPDGEMVEYYNFDVQSESPAPIYALFHENGDPVEGQMNVIDVIPGDEGYNDFWHVHKVTVPEDYEANVVTSVDDIMEAGYDVEPTGMIKNCPVVPEGSTASKHFGDDHDEAPVVDGWYDGEVVSYFLFEEDSFEATDDGNMPLSPIYVSFNKNPNEEGGGPPSGFMTEEGSDQTHNVVATLPGDDSYSPLWMVNPYDNADFDDVSDLDSATGANVLAMGAATVNCPIVSMS
jgi:hypothetical protein